MQHRDIRSFDTNAISWPAMSCEFGRIDRDGLPLRAVAGFVAYREQRGSRPAP
jgi:hypothetical protein